MTRANKRADDIMFNEALKAIIDLLKLRKDAKKADLEIAKLEREQKSSGSLIQRASFDDITRFDAATRKRMERARHIDQQAARLPPGSRLPEPPRARSSWLLWPLLLAGLLYAVYEFLM